MAVKAVAPITKRTKQQHLEDLGKSLYELESSRDNIFACGLEPGQVGFLCGPGGQGKTFLILQLAMSLATGLPLLGPSLAPAKEGRVVYVALEETQEEMSRREAAIRDVYTALGFAFPVEKISSNLDIYNISDNGASVGLFQPNGDINTDMISALENAVNKNTDHDAARLLILDPLNWLIGLDETKNEVASRFMPLLISYAKRWNCAILIIGHITKSTSRDAKTGTGEPMAEDLRGAGAFSTGARWVANLVPACPPKKVAPKTSKSKQQDATVEAEFESAIQIQEAGNVKKIWNFVRMKREEQLRKVGREDLCRTDPLCRDFPYHPTDIDAILTNRLKIIGTKRNSGGAALGTEWFVRVQGGVLLPDAWGKTAYDADFPEVPTLYLPPLPPEEEEVLPF